MRESTYPMKSIFRKAYQSNLNVFTDEGLFLLSVSTVVILVLAWIICD